MDLCEKISSALMRNGFPNRGYPLGEMLYFDDLQDKTIFSCNVTAGVPTADISNFEVEEGCKGNHLGAVTLQTIAKHFEQAGALYIGIHLVRHEGLSFWPYFGAMHNMGAPSQRAYSQPFIEDRYWALHGKILGTVFELAGKDEDAAWYHLTDPKTNTPRELIERLNLRSTDSSMYMNLSHAPVRERLGLDKS